MYMYMYKHSIYMQIGHSHYSYKTLIGMHKIHVYIVECIPIKVL